MTKLILAFSILETGLKWILKKVNGMSCTGFVRFRNGTIQVVSRCEHDSAQMSCTKCGLFLNFRYNKLARRTLLHGVIYVYKILP